MAFGDSLFHLVFSSTMTLNTYVFRSALLLVILGVIWVVMGEELLTDVLRVYNSGKDQLSQGLDTPFGEFPWWLQTLAVLLAVFAAITVALLIYLIIRRLRG